ncbi:MAG: glycosyltransferase family 2 protein [Caldimicrobium sp.]
MPKVSVIMGVMNAASRIDESIKSIIEQTFTDWEFIICDDGSIDNTYSKLLEWQKKDKRIIPIKNEKNIGLAATLNHCIRYCNGKYIARMDDDDFSYPSRFQKQVDFLDDNTEYAFVSSSCKIFDGKKVYEPKKLSIEKPKKEDFLWSSRFIHPATMFRTQALKEANGYREAKETIKSQDYDLFMRLYSKGMIGYNIQEPLLCYYVNPAVKRKKLKYKFRINESIIRYKGFKAMGILLPKGIPYIFKPLIVGFIPVNILELAKRKYN